MKKQLLTGVEDLLEQPTTTAQAEPAEKTAKPKYKTYCYALDPEVAEKIEYIARYDRKKQNAVLTEAINKYAAEWTPAPQERPRSFK